MQTELEGRFARMARGPRCIRARRPSMLIQVDKVRCQSNREVGTMQGLVGERDSEALLLDIITVCINKVCSCRQKGEWQSVLVPNGGLARETRRTTRRRTGSYPRLNRRYVSSR